MEPKRDSDTARLNNKWKRLTSWPRSWSKPVAPTTSLPFLRWIGGKQHLAALLSKHIPRELICGRYFEPFVGAAGLFFRLAPHRAVLADANGHLINCYSHVRNDPRQVARLIDAHAALDSHSYYYQVRQQYNNARSQCTVTQAARFIYLNRTCFNGVFRVNMEGHFNVPYGYKTAPRFPGVQDLENAALLLKGAILKTADFRAALTIPRAGDFIYLDPPYPALDDTAYFAHYTASRFSLRDHCELAEIVNSLSSKGCSILVSNADTSFIRKLYRDFNRVSLPRCRFVSCKSHKRRVSELLMKNF